MVHRWAVENAAPSDAVCQRWPRYARRHSTIALPPAGAACVSEVLRRCVTRPSGDSRTPQSELQTTALSGGGARLARPVVLSRGAIAARQSAGGVSRGDTGYSAAADAQSASTSTRREFGAGLLCRARRRPSRGDVAGPARGRRRESLDVARTTPGRWYPPAAQYSLVLAGSSGEDDRRPRGRTRRWRDPAIPTSARAGLHDLPPATAAKF